MKTIQAVYEEFLAAKEISPPCFSVICSVWLVNWASLVRRKRFNDGHCYLSSGEFFFSFYWGGDSFVALNSYPKPRRSL